MVFLNYLFIFVLLGPPLPKKLYVHEMFRFGHDLIVIGGQGYSGYSGSLYKLSCKNYKCKWQILTQELKTPRQEFVAIPIPDDFVNCE